MDKDSSDRRINGEIWEAAIRTKESQQILREFLQKPQTDLNHLRLGYIRDTSYIGRGNGKSAFLVNLMHMINRDYCMDLSSDRNKCFCLYVTPVAGGRTKTFGSFVDLLFDAICQTGIIKTCLASLRLAAIEAEYPDVEIPDNDEEGLVANLNSEEWLTERGIDLSKLTRAIGNNPFLQSLPAGLPFPSRQASLFPPFVEVDSFRDYYFHQLKKAADKLDFVFSHLVQFFLASGFNGAYVLVDDFERIPDFQSARQRIDFARELRGCLLDGPYAGARYGFYNMLLVLHAGVPPLISEAWQLSGLENRYAITPKVEAKHIIPFEKLTPEHVSLLLKKYLGEFRMGAQNGDRLAPFAPEAIDRIAEMCEYNAAKILRSCWDLLEVAAHDSDRTTIDEAFVQAHSDTQDGRLESEAPVMDDPNATNLMDKATGGK